MRKIYNKKAPAATIQRSKARMVATYPLRRPVTKIYSNNYQHSLKRSPNRNCGSTQPSKTSPMVGSEVQIPKDLDIPVDNGAGELRHKRYPAPDHINNILGNPISLISTIIF
ncbi:hypothetical protein U1Q18_018097 [Sarracenia purpurea var. burkii]